MDLIISLCFSPIPSKRPVVKAIFYFLKAGANDLGGISPITPDYINPNNHWPNINELINILRKNGFRVKERLPIYPEFIEKCYLSDKVYEIISKLVDEKGYVRES